MGSLTVVGCSPARELVEGFGFAGRRPKDWGTALGRNAVGLVDTPPLGGCGGRSAEQYRKGEQWRFVPRAR